MKILPILRLIGLMLLLVAGATRAFAAPAPGTIIRDCPEPACPTMVYIPQGSFMMGALDGETFLPHEPADPKERPRHKVTFAKPFAIGQHEVTRAEFAAFVAATNYQTPMRCSYTGRTVQLLHDRDWKYPTVPQYSDQEPVLCTNYIDAVSYADWLTRKTGHKYRPPSEAEWEYAGRAGTNTYFFWGNGTKIGCHYSNVMDLAVARARNEDITPEMKAKLCDSGKKFKPDQQMTDVMTYLPNPWGLYGISGNGWELAADCWHQDYVGAPTDGSAWIDNPDCNERITRGDGGWLSNWAHIAHRYPVFEDEHRSNTGTFRVVRELD